LQGLGGVGGPMTRARAPIEESLQGLGVANKKDLEAIIQNVLLIEGQ